ncbi:MAG TPA: ribbon-helix-helix protein, CopG family [Candidatus Saccharimonadia bacterium]
MASTQGIKLDDETRNRLKALGEKRDRSPHWLMRTAIESYLEREEKYEREKAEDMQRWEQYQLAGKALDQTAAEAWLNSLSQGKSASWHQ